jgi:putative membrane protein
VEEEMKFLTRWVITGLAVFAAAFIVKPGISVESNGWVVYAVMALILSLVNTFLRPILKFLSCPLILLTLGIFVLVINGLTFWLASKIAVNWFHVGFYVDGFWPAFWGALIVSVVSIFFNLIIKDEK